MNKIKLYKLIIKNNEKVIEFITNYQNIKDLNSLKDKILNIYTVFFDNSTELDIDIVLKNFIYKSKAVAEQCLLSDDILKNKEYVDELKIKFKNLELNHKKYELLDLTKKLINDLIIICITDGLKTISIEYKDEKCNKRARELYIKYLDDRMQYIVNDNNNYDILEFSQSYDFLYNVDKHNITWDILVEESDKMTELKKEYIPSLIK